MTDASGGGQTRYVALEHTRADGTHCDLMLEHDRKLITWALEQLDALVEQGEARGERLPDHRTFYLDHEGPVSGGRGSVKRLASGTIGRMDCGPRRVHATLEGDLAGTLIAEHVQGNFWRITFLKERGS